MAEADRERWDRRHAEADVPSASGGWLEALGDELPQAGRALDVASGRGGLSLWLAQRGLAVSALDVSPVALERLRQAAKALGVAVDARQLDLERDALPDGAFDFIACWHYRQAGLHAALCERLAPGGLLALEQHTVDNLQRHARPGRDYLAERGELARFALDGAPVPLQLCYYREGWLGDRAVARVLARRLDARA
ncbi:MAG: class I SAM-dependent methyltransferase [Myxococcales bacterium]|nr:class I SAM-dependent methyltransferase [Myxococcales bacterium]